MNITFKFRKDSREESRIAFYAVMLDKTPIGHYILSRGESTVEVDLYLPDTEGKIIETDFPDEISARREIPTLVLDWYREAGKITKRQIRDQNNLFAYWGNYAVGIVVKQKGEVFAYECKENAYFGGNTTPINLKTEQIALERIYDFYDCIQKEIK